MQLAYARSRCKDLCRRPAAGSADLVRPGGQDSCRPAPLLLLLLQRPLGVLLVEPHALERSLLGGSAAVEVEARVGELLEELGLQHRQADDAAGGLGVPGDVLAALPQAPAVALGGGELRGGGWGGYKAGRAR
jgi:hypothetical protein